MRLCACALEVRHLSACQGTLFLAHMHVSHRMVRVRRGYVACGGCARDQITTPSTPPLVWLSRDTLFSPPSFPSFTAFLICCTCHSPGCWVVCMYFSQLVSPLDGVHCAVTTRARCCPSAHTFHTLSPSILLYPPSPTLFPLTLRRISILLLLWAFFFSCPISVVGTPVQS